jgi:hypothetical protein
MQSEGVFQFTLRELLAVTAYIAFALGIGRWTASPTVAVQFLLFLIGLGVVRFAHGHLGAVIPSLLGIDLLTCYGIDLAYFGNVPGFMDFRPAFACLGGSLLILIGLGVFLWQARSNRPYRKAQLGLALFMLTFLVGWYAIVPTIGRATVAQRRARDTAANNLAMSQAIAQVEAIRARLGRIPDDAELKSLLDEPLPSVRIDGYVAQISYQHTAANEYQLSYCFWDILTYCSSTPNKGWYRIPF